MNQISLSTKRLAKLFVAIMFFTTPIGCGGKLEGPNKRTTAKSLSTGNAGGDIQIPQPEMTFQIWDPWNRSPAFRVWLDIDSLRAQGLTKEDVMRAVTPTRLSDPMEPHPHGVVIVPNLSSQDPLGEIIVKATPEGDVTRLQDIAKIELLDDRETREVEPDGGSK